MLGTMRGDNKISTTTMDYGYHYKTLCD